MEGELFTVPAVEESKCLTVYGDLCRRMAQRGYQRSDGILALGGGMTGDLAGFAAATYQRGMTLVQMPTSLLAQVDSCIGGKTGLDLPEGKNLLGAFYRPRMVIVDPDCLQTLPLRQLHSGAAEVIKYGLIADPDILTQLETEPDWECLIEKCLRIKAHLVQQDERDTGARRILNFGHTFGHAYERSGGYQVYTHGEAVAAGMAQMLRWQIAQGERLQPVYERLTTLLRRYELPERIACEREKLFTWIARDKKAEADGVVVITLSSTGGAAQRKVSVSSLLEVGE